MCSRRFLNDSVPKTATIGYFRVPRALACRFYWPLSVLILKKMQKIELFCGFLLYKVIQSPYDRVVQGDLKHFRIVLFYAPGRQNRQMAQSSSNKFSVFTVQRRVRWPK